MLRLINLNEKKIGYLIDGTDKKKHNNTFFLNIIHGFWMCTSLRVRLTLL